MTTVREKIQAEIDQIKSEAEEKVAKLEAGLQQLHVTALEMPIEIWHTIENWFESKK